MSLLLKKEGIFTSVQGVGHFGLQSFGFNPRGAMDRTAARTANILAGNNDDANVLEMHFPAAEIEFDAGCRFALAGADFTASLDGQYLANWCLHFAKPGQVLRFEKKSVGNRSYLAVDGGFEPDCGTAFSTIRKEKGDLLRTRTSASTLSATDRSVSVSKNVLPAYSSFPTVRILPGGEFGSLSEVDRQALLTEAFTISNDSNRMGFRLKGPSLAVRQRAEMVSAAVTFGTIQLPPDGQLIVLMADHQTSGGYPRIANVISADLPILAQLGPGEKVSFMPVEIFEAEQAAAQREADLAWLRTGVRFGRYW